MQAPYIGITGVQTREDSALMCELADKSTKVGRKIMVGILACDMTLRGMPSPWISYPKTEKISNLFGSHPNHLNLIHYNASPKKLGRRVDIVEDLERLTEIAGENLHGFQINPPIFPTPTQLADFRAKHPKTKIVLSAPRKQTNPVEFLKSYGESIDYALLDRSYGQGKPLDPQQTADLAAQLGHLSLVAAGGLQAGAFVGVRQLINQNPNISFDAQGKLMDKDGYLKHAATMAYVEDAIAHLESPGI